MPTLDLALGLGMVWRAADVIHAVVLDPVREITGDGFPHHVDIPFPTMAGAVVSTRCPPGAGTT